MNHLTKWALLLIAAVAFNAVLAACGKEKEDEEPATLKVNPNAISLVSMSNSSATFQIECNQAWSISGCPEWLNLSSISGVGNTTVTATALSENNSASVRSAVISVSAGDLTASVNVTQVAGLKSGCDVSIANEVILDTSYAFELSFGANASYYYAGFLPASSAGWSDAKILEGFENDEAHNCENGMVHFADYLTESTTYIFCAVAYDPQGNRGEILRKTFTTGKSSNAPQAYISDVYYTSTLWLWDTTISATANEYYMLVYSGDDALYVKGFAPAMFGMFYKAQESDLVSYVNSTSWNRTRPSGDNNLAITTWAKRSGKWSSVLNVYQTSIKSGISKKTGSVKAVRQASGGKAGVLMKVSRSKFEEINKDCKIYRIR